ncbi:hypothetical protein C5167_030995 [Papaver somniferum]|nr:hypothetical protein C5167_030995 [Papaver somniferum]
MADIQGGSPNVWTKRKKMKLPPEEHYNYSAEAYKKKKIVAVKGKWASKRLKNVKEGDRCVAETSNQPDTDDNCDFE